MAADKEKQKEFIDLLKIYKDGEKGRFITNPARDPNSYLRRFTRLYVDGSYSYPNGEEGSVHYERIRKALMELKEKGFDKPASKKKLRSIAIQEFAGLAKVEFELTPPQIMAAFKKAGYNAKDIEDFNNDIIEDLKDSAVE